MPSLCHACLCVSGTPSPLSRGKLITISNSVTTNISVSANQNHTLRTVKDGYNDVHYREILVETGEKLSIETLMQVPYDSNNPTGSAKLTLKNAQTGNVLPDVKITIRKGMNNTTGEKAMEIISDKAGHITIDSLVSGNYTGTIECDGYIKTICNFVIIGGKTKSYEVHVSPIISISQIRIVLSWGANPSDLDSHFSGNGYHVYYANKTDTGVVLDVDDRNGYGPETTTVDLSKLPAGDYLYYIHHYSGSGSITTSGASIKVYNGDRLIKTYYADQSTVVGKDWSVFSINSVTGTIK